MKKLLTVSFAIAVAIGCLAFDPADYERRPEIDATYVARAEFRNFRGLVYVNDPNDIVIRQRDEKLLIEAESGYLFQIIDEPVTIPEKDRGAISSALGTDSPVLLKKLNAGPMMGPMAVFIVFNRHREATAIVHQHLNIYYTTHVQPAGEGDTFQSIGKWSATAKCSELTKLVGVSKAPSQPRETPFTRWKSAKKK